MDGPRETTQESATRKVGQSTHVQDCFVKARTRGELEAGVHNVRIQVGPDGAVWSARPVDDDLWGTELSGCLRREIVPMVLAPPASGTTEVLIQPFQVP